MAAPPPSRADLGGRVGDGLGLAEGADPGRDVDDVAWASAVEPFRRALVYQPLRSKTRL